METVEHLVIGAGPAGLRAAQVLAGAGREVLVAEKRPEIGPKTCAGGLTLKTMRELLPLGLPPGAAAPWVGHVAFRGSRAIALDQERTVVHTISRRLLGQFQAGWARAAGAEIVVGTPVGRLDLTNRTAVVDGQPIRWRHLIGADGADSAVRRALGLPSPRAYFAAEYNISIPSPGLGIGMGIWREPLRVECDPRLLANGYFWVFPHATYTSIGAVADRRLVSPPAVRRYLDARMAGLGLNVSHNDAPFEGATLEVDFRGFHFGGEVHLVGDAAGAASSITAEGIYAALITGEEVACSIVEPSFSAPKSAAWLRVKQRHDRLAAALAHRTTRTLALALLAVGAWCRPLRRGMTEWFLAAG